MLSKAIVLSALLLTVLPGAVSGQPAPFAALDSLLQAEVDEEHIAGAVLQVVRGGNVLHRRAYGYAQRYAYSMEPLRPPAPLTTEHLFDLASLTKVFATTFAVMVLVDQDRVALDAPVRTYLPEFTGGGKEAVTVRHLLTHTAGLSEWVPLYYHAATSEATYGYIAGLPLKYEVGAARHYSDLGFMLLGYLVERVTGRRLDAFLREQIYAPLGLRHTTFVPLQHGFGPAQIAATSHGNPFERRMVYDDTFGYECEEDPTAWDGWRHYTLRGEVNDGNAYHANGGVAGHAGLFSTASDLQRLIDLLLNEGRHQDAELISPETVRAFLTKGEQSATDEQGVTDEQGNGLGWAMDPAIIQARGAPEGTYGHTGFTGTSVIVIPEHDLSIILLTNRQNMGTNEAGTYYNLNPTRQAVVSMVLQALGMAPSP